MCAWHGPLLIWSIAITRAVSETNVAVSGQRWVSPNIDTRQTEEGHFTIHSQTNSTTNTSSPLFLHSDSGAILKYNNNNNNNAPTKSSKSYRVSPDQPELHNPLLTSRIIEKLIPDLVTRESSTNESAWRPTGQNNRRRRREASPAVAVSRSRATLPLVKIIVRVKRGRERIRDFTQVNRDVCPPSLCRILDERSRGGGGRPRGTGGTVFYQGDIVLDRDLDRVIYPPSRPASQMRSGNQRRNRARAATTRKGSAGKRRKNRKKESGNKRKKEDLGKRDQKSQNCSDRKGSQCSVKRNKPPNNYKTSRRRIKRSSDNNGIRNQNEAGFVEDVWNENEAGLNEDTLNDNETEADGGEWRDAQVSGTESQWRTEERSGRTRRATMKLRNRLWKNGVVVYKMGREIRPEARRVIQRAFHHIQKRTCIRFREKTDRDTDFIRFISEPGCWSQIGRVGGTQMVSLGRGCESLGTAVHEIVHSLGVWHEQARPDRNRFVRILEDNVSERFRPDFEPVGRRLATDRGYPYDYQSLMHYSQYAFTRNGEPTIQVIGTGRRLKLRIGQRRGLSTIDLSQLRDMYKCNQKQDIKETVCHRGWEKHLTSCYKFVTSYPAHFDAAHRMCKREKGQLVAIENSREQRFIDNIIGEQHPRFTRWRTAGRRVNNTMVWYLDDKKVKNISRYENWARGHPGSRPSLVLYRDSRSGRVKWIGDWMGDYRIPNHHRHPFICKKPAWRKCVELRYRDGRDYRGHLDHTRDGYTCQRWTENYPHDHPLVNVSRAAAAWMRASSKGNNNSSSSSRGGNSGSQQQQEFSDGLGTHNKCRNPSGLRRNRPWCYTTKRRHEWGYCDVSACASSLRPSGRGSSRGTSSRQGNTRGNLRRSGSTRDLETGQASAKRGSSRQSSSRTRTPRQNFPKGGNPRASTPRSGNPRKGSSSQKNPRSGKPRQRTAQRATPRPVTPRKGTARLTVSAQKTPGQGKPSRRTPRR